MKKPGFLDGGGEMGKLIRNYNWENTSIGKPENWPVTLKNTVGIVLHSAFPQFLFWGNDLITFYNDPFRPSLGVDGKHPAIGKKGKEVWPEIWDFIGPLIEKVMTTGEAVYFEDQLVPFFRNGKIEDIYWTFSYSPAYGDDGKIDGVFVTCTETTGKVNALSVANETANQLKFAIDAAELGTWELNPLTNKFMGNTRLKEWFGLMPEEEIELSLAINRIAEKDRAKVSAAISQALTYESGGHYDIEYTIENPVTCKEIIVKAKGKAYFDEQKKPHKFSGTLQDVTRESEIKKQLAVELDEQKRIYKQVEESETRFRNLVEDAPVAMSVSSGRDYVVEIANERMFEIWGKKPGDVLGKPVFEAMPEARGQGFEEILDEIFTTGEPFKANEILINLNRNGKSEPVYLNLVYQPVRGHDGTVTGIMQVAIDVTVQVVARQKIEESEAHLQLTRNTIPAMVFYMDVEQRYQSYNGVFMEWFNVNATEALGKTSREFIGEAAYAKAAPFLARAYAGERVEYHTHAPQRIGGEKWLNIVYTPHKNSDDKVIGVIVHATDITEHMLALKKIEESEARFRNLLKEAPVAATLFRGPELIIEIANELTLKYWGKSKTILGKPLAEAAPELEDQQMIALVRSVYERGGMVSFSETPIRFIEDGVLKDGFYSFSLKALYNGNGDVESILSTGIDVTEQVNTRKQIEQSEKELRDLIKASPIGICVLSGDPVCVEEVNDRFLIISGKTREQYASAPYWEVLSEVAHIFEPILAGVFKTGIKYTTEENEMVLVRDGLPERLSITFEYVPVFNPDNKVSKVIVMAVEVTHQVETRKRIEEAVIERTKELAESNLHLKRSNEELEQFAYIASHDLQEPLRKISTFTQMLEHSIKDISAKSQDYISKIYSSTDRMAKLIHDVLAFSLIKEEKNDFEQVDLNKIIDTLTTDFELQIEQTEATIENSELPTIDAIQTQMIQLFGNLLSNSLKYRKPGVRPVIKISASVANPEKVAKHSVFDRNIKYYHIEFSDNGIGFDIEHIERIFRIFQRLHGKTEFEGTGIGLAICRRIVQNHTGHISAAVGENGGAVFNILLPQIHDKAGNNPE